MRHHRGQRQAKHAQHSEDALRKLFTEACLHGLRTRLCDGVDALAGLGDVSRGLHAPRVDKLIGFPLLQPTSMLWRPAL